MTGVILLKLYFFFMYTGGAQYEAMSNAASILPIYGRDKPEVFLTKP